jgi:hypothetical protein
MGKSQGDSMSWETYVVLFVLHHLFSVALQDLCYGTSDVL